GPPGGRLRSMKSRKNRSKGEPGGNCGISGPPRSPRALTDWLVEMLTTAGRSFAARSAKLSGAERAKATGASDVDAGAATVMTSAASPTRSITAPRRGRARGDTPDDNM